MAEQQKGIEKMRSAQVRDLSPREQTNIDDVRDDSRLERVELLAADAQARADLEAEGFGEDLAQLAVTTEEEVDALRINLLQGDEPAGTRNSTGRVVDKRAEERIRRFTGSDPIKADLGAAGVEPGHDNTSEVLRIDHHDASIRRSEALAEGNLEEPIDESVSDSRKDEGT